MNNNNLELKYTKERADSYQNKATTIYDNIDKALEMKRTGQTIDLQRPNVDLYNMLYSLQVILSVILVGSSNALKRKKVNYYGKGGKNKNTKKGLKVTVDNGKKSETYDIKVGTDYNPNYLRDFFFEKSKDSVNAVVKKVVSLTDILFAKYIDLFTLNVLNKPWSEITKKTNDRLFTAAATIQRVATEPATKEAIQIISDQLTDLILTTFDIIEPEVYKINDRVLEASEEVISKNIANTSRVLTGVFNAMLAEIPMVGGPLVLAVNFLNGFNKGLGSLGPALEANTENLMSGTAAFLNVANNFTKRAGPISNSISRLQNITTPTLPSIPQTPELNAAMIKADNLGEDVGKQVSKNLSNTLVNKTISDDKKRNIAQLGGANNIKKIIKNINNTTRRVNKTISKFYKTNTKTKTKIKNKRKKTLKK